MAACDPTWLILGGAALVKVGGGTADLLLLPVEALAGAVGLLLPGDPPNFGAAEVADEPPKRGGDDGGVLAAGDLPALPDEPLKRGVVGVVLLVDPEEPPNLGVELVWPEPELLLWPEPELPEEPPNLPPEEDGLLLDEDELEGLLDEEEDPDDRPDEEEPDERLLLLPFWARTSSAVPTKKTIAVITARVRRTSLFMLPLSDKIGTEMGDTVTLCPPSPILIALVEPFTYRRRPNRPKTPGRLASAA